MHTAAVLIVIVASLVVAPVATANPMSYLDNGVSRLGVDLGVHREPAWAKQCDAD